MDTTIHGTIFNIQHYSIHDGPGIRTVVFFKGCPLRCLWCCNPESWNSHIETERSILGTAKTVGYTQTVKEVISEIEKDRIFYRKSGGGVTFSGGEVLMQPDFLYKLLQTCYDRNIHTAIETSGYASWSVIKQMLDVTDLFLYDIKHMDLNRHKELTGVSNEPILKNLAQLAKQHAKIVIRMPFLPEYNGTEDNLIQIAEFMKMHNLSEIHLMPFHQLGKDKYRKLDREYPLKDMLPLTNRTDGAQKLMQAKSLLESFGHQVLIGG